MAEIISTIIAAVVGPTIMAVVFYFVRRKEKAEDRAQLEAVAEKAKEAARLVAAAAVTLREADKRRSENTRFISDQLIDIQETGKQTHALVNSKMTAVLQTMLISLQAQLVVLLENVQLRSRLGEEPTIESLAAIEALKSKIAELQATLGAIPKG